MSLYIVICVLGTSSTIQLLNIHQLAELIGCSDYNERICFHVWRVMDQGSRMEHLFIVHLAKEHTVFLEDRYGNYIEGADYPAH